MIAANEEHSAGLRFGGNAVRATVFVMLAAASVYALSWAALNLGVVHGVQREGVRIDGPSGKPCLGTIWTPPSPKAVMLLGHGVTANQGVMAMAANAFTRNGYIAVTLDFWGHGRSRERFDWASNHAQVNAWCAWARTRFPGMPLGYLGHSMGGEAGDRAFRKEANVDAFVSMGMLPGEVPDCKTLLAFGRFEELFSPERARERAGDKADVLISPYSDHNGEAADPVLIEGIIEWVNGALGLDQPATFPWLRWAVLLIATMVGLVAALVIAERVTSLVSSRVEAGRLSPTFGPGRFNLFRAAARAIGCTGEPAPPRSGSWLSAAARGAVFSLVLVALLSWLFTMNVYTCSLLHPERCLTWLVLVPIITGLFFVTIPALERTPLHTGFQRFAVGALTRAVPLLGLCLVLQLIGPGIAFLGMMLGILAVVFVFIAGVHALATRGAGDYRSGAVACGITLSWIAAFWFPLVWG